MPALARLARTHPGWNSLGEAPLIFDGVQADGAHYSVGIDDRNNGHRFMRRCRSASPTLLMTPPKRDILYNQRLATVGQVCCGINLVQDSHRVKLRRIFGRNPPDDLLFIASAGRRPALPRNASHNTDGSNAQRPIRNATSVINSSIGTKTCPRPSEWCSPDR